MRSASGKIFLRVEEELKEEWVETCEARKVDQNIAGGSLVTWFVKQSPAIQRQIIENGDVEGEIFRARLAEIAVAKAMATDATSEVTFDMAMDVARLMLDKMGQYKAMYERIIKSEASGKATKKKS